jgi:hypothetical protein
LAISNGFELEGGPEPIRQWLSDWLEEQNILQTLRVVASDMLIFGNAYLELCRNGDTREGAIEWLKPLDPVHMRVRRDAYGQVLGYIQLLTFPPVVFTAQDIVHFKWGAKSWTYEQAYGTSLLRPLLKIQALIDQLEDDMAIIVHCYAKPMLVVKAGTPERPFADRQLQSLVDAFKDRKPATDVFVRGDVDVQVIPSLTKDVNITWWLDYLYTQREAVLGVPKIFMGKSEGTNRACYSEDTYVLTDKGWKLHQDIACEKIAVYSPNSGKIRFQKPVCLLIYEYEGSMYNFVSKDGVDVLVTPEHRMLFKVGGSDWRIDMAENLPQKGAAFKIVTINGGKPAWESSDPVEVSKVPYKGKVYCFVTSTGFYVTARKGIPVIQGNTAEVVMQEYVTRLRMMQEIIGDQLETCLFKQMIEGRFGKGIEVPRIKWKPIWEPTVQDKAKYLCDLVDKGIILPKEARKELGFPEEYPIAKMEELQAVLARNGAKGWDKP